MQPARHPATPSLLPRTRSRVQTAGPAAALVLAAAALLVSVGAARAQAVDPRNTGQLMACLTKASERPDEALEDGLVWRARSGGIDAEHCIAVARIELGDIETGARTLVSLAASPYAGDAASRAQLLVKAANAWLLIEDYAPAEAALTRALELVPDAQGIFLDRARARALGGRWADAEVDLGRALAQGEDAFAYRLRAEVRMQQGRYDEADADIAAAERLEPRAVETNLVRGRIREARRLGRAPD